MIFLSKNLGTKTQVSFWTKVLKSSCIDCFQSGWDKTCLTFRGSVTHIVIVKSYGLSMSICGLENKTEGDIPILHDKD